MNLFLISFTKNFFSQEEFQNKKEKFIMVFGEFGPVCFIIHSLWFNVLASGKQTNPFPVGNFSNEDVECLVYNFSIDI